MSHPGVDNDNITSRVFAKLEGEGNKVLLRVIHIHVPVLITQDCGSVP